MEIPRRQEIKYLVSNSVRFSLLKDLHSIYSVDDYVNEDHSFYINRNLYFDNHINSAVDEKLNGLESRDKLRLRSYQSIGDEKKYFAEIKSRRGEFVIKGRSQISEEVTRALVQGHSVDFNPLDFNLRKFLYLKIQNGLIPSCTLSYKRIPFMRRTPGVYERVTFDFDLMFGPGAFFFSNEDLILMDNSFSILEFKFIDSISEEMKILIRKYGLTRVSVSKYVLAMQCLNRLK